MIYLDNSPPLDNIKDFKYKSMFIKNKQDKFTIEAQSNLIITNSGYEEFNAELILEVHTLGVLYHLKACEEIRTLSHVSELLSIAKMKTAFANFKKASSIFAYIEEELSRGNKYKHPSINIPELSPIVNLVLSKLSEIHALMAIFEKNRIDRPDQELLDKSNMTQYVFLAKIGKKIVITIDDLAGN